MRILSSFFWIVLGTAFSLFLLVLALRLVRRVPGGSGASGMISNLTGLSV